MTIKITEKQEISASFVFGAHKYGPSNFQNMMNNIKAWFKFLFSIPRLTSTPDLWTILDTSLFYSHMSAQGCCSIHPRFASEHSYMSGNTN